jgi:hypothetical protein
MELLLGKPQLSHLDVRALGGAHEGEEKKSSEPHHLEL